MKKFGHKLLKERIYVMLWKLEICYSKREKTVSKISFNFFFSYSKEHVNTVVTLFFVTIFNPCTFYKRKRQSPELCDF